MATVFGVPKEVKEQEGWLSMQPDGVAELGDHGHEVFVQAAAGEGEGFEDQGYVSCGARVVETTDGVFEGADLIVKVKEPVPEEYDRFHEGQELVTFFHLAADKEFTEYLMDRKVNSIVYETVELPEGSLPLLASDERDGQEDGGPGLGAAPGEHAGWDRAPCGWRPRLQAGRRGARAASYLPRADPRPEQERT
jgi:Alanine dehydrogenase/PNT, N-terminal domain